MRARLAGYRPLDLELRAYLKAQSIIFNLKIGIASIQYFSNVLLISFIAENEEHDLNYITSWHARFAM